MLLINQALLGWAEVRQLEHQAPEICIIETPDSIEEGIDVERR